MKNKNIAIDIDDVLADYSKCVTKYHNEKYGTNLKKEDIKSWDLSKAFNCSKEESIKRIFESYNSVYFHFIKKINNSKYALNILNEKNNIVIISARPREIYYDTYMWLFNNYGENISNKLYLTNELGKKGFKTTKLNLCKMFGCELLIDDEPHNAKVCANAGIEVLLMNQPWNQIKELDETKNIKRVYGWIDILEHFYGELY